MNFKELFESQKLFDEDDEYLNIYENNIIKYLKKYSIKVEKGDMFVEDDSLYIPFSGNTHNGEIDKKVIKPLEKYSEVDFIEVNDYRIEIYFDTDKEIEIY